MRLQQLYKVIQDTKTTDELMHFIPAISSTISRASSSNVNFTTEVIFFRSHQGAFQNVTIQKLAFSRFKTIVQSTNCRL